MTTYLAVEEILDIAEIACGGSVTIRDFGLLESAAHRPQASMFGQEAYLDLHAKAAALLQSLTVNHPLVDGNKRTAWLAVYTFCVDNGVTLNPNDDDAYDLVVSVAAGEIDDVEKIAQTLRSFSAGK